MVLSYRFRFTPTEIDALTLREMYMYCDAADAMLREEKKAAAKK